MATSEMAMFQVGAAGGATSLGKGELFNLAAWWGRSCCACRSGGHAWEGSRLSLVALHLAPRSPPPAPSLTTADDGQHGAPRLQGRERALQGGAPRAAATLLMRQHASVPRLPPCYCPRRCGWAAALHAAAWDFAATSQNEPWPSGQLPVPTLAHALSAPASSFACSRLLPSICSLCVCNPTATPALQQGVSAGRRKGRTAQGRGRIPQREAGWWYRAVGTAGVHVCIVHCACAGR